MAKLKIHAGDFDTKKPGAVNKKSFMLYSDPQELLQHKLDNLEKKNLFGALKAGVSAGAASFKAETISFDDIEEIEEASEDNVKRIGGTIGWGAAGAALLGPAGMLAGLLLGGKGKEITFVCKFKDGRRLLATVDSKTWLKMQSQLF